MKFNTPEMSLIVDALNGVRTIDGITFQSYLLANVSDAIEIDRLDRKWHVPRNAFIEKLKALPENEAKRIVQHTERFWENSPHTDLERGLYEAKLLTIETAEDFVGYVGTRLKRIRLANELTQTEFAEMFGFENKEAVARIERGIAKSVSSYFVLQICTRFGLSYEDILPPTP